VAYSTRGRVNVAVLEYGSSKPMVFQLVAGSESGSDVQDKGFRLDGPLELGQHMQLVLRRLVRDAVVRLPPSSPHVVERVVVISRPLVLKKEAEELSR